MKRILLALLLIISANHTHSLDPNGFEQITHLGYVYARAIVRDENSGFPLWAEYNEQGGHTKLSVDLAAASEGRVVSGATYRGYATALESFKEQYEGKVEVLSKQDYISKAQSGALTTNNGQAISNWPTDLHESILTVAIPAKEKRFQFDGARIEKLFFPADLIATPTVGENIQSILMGKDGTFLADSDLRIGYLTAFTANEDGVVEDVAEYDPGRGYAYSSSQRRRKILDPVPDVFIETFTGNRDAKVTSDERGFYRAQAFPAPCPGFIYHPEMYATARLYYANFHPRGNPALPYWLETKSYNSCNGLALLLQSSGNLVGLMTAVTIMGMVAAAPENIHRIDYPVAVNIIGGMASIAGATVGEETTYKAEESSYEEYMAPDDYDGDGTLDGSVRGDFNAEGIFEASGDGKYYGVFLSSKENTGQPDFVHVMDVMPDLRHKGFVETIKEDDLKDTDILVFRESTGDLITERNGFTDEEMDKRRFGRADINENSVAYSLAIRSVEDHRSTYRRLYGRDGFQDWQAKNDINPKLHAHKSDFLRNGEVLRIVAINRATGYMGTALTRMNAARDGGDITVYVPPIVMTPPNLKVWATRRYQPQGLEKSAERERHTISNEGAATTDDYVIEVHTKWMDTNGLPLPPGLEGRGYTGRLVKVASDPNQSTDPYSTQVSEFAIDPGTKLQAIKFQEGEAGKYHYHLQVNGQSDAEPNDFSSGELSGVLRHRPNKFVPVIVPLYDEVMSNINELVQKQAAEDAGVEVEDIEPAFNWVYRPELSFSVVDLEVEAATRYEGSVKQNNIMKDDIPAIASSDSAVELLYSLAGSQFDRITPLDSEQTFIFAFGEEEVKVEVSKGTGNKTNLKFDNIDHLADLDPEDYLSIRLYLNEDSQNVLWSYSFEYLHVESRVVDHDLETTDRYYVSADDPIVPLNATLIGFAGREDEDKKPRTVKWMTTNGSFSEQTTQTDSEIGVFANDLEMPTTAGQTADVEVLLQNTQTVAKFKTIEVIPGAPASITLYPVGDTVRPGVMGTKNFQLEAFVKDAHGNAVSDGTAIDFSLEGFGSVVAADTATSGGKALFTLTGSQRYDSNLKAIVKSGAAVQEYATQTESLNIEIDIPTDLHVRRQYSATVRITDEDGSKLPNMPVIFSSPHLAVVDSGEIITDSNGEAQITLQTPTVPALDTYLHARVGYAGSARLPIVVRNVVGKDYHLKAENFQPLLGEYSDNGAFSYTRYDDADIDFAYNASKTFTLMGDVDGSQTLTLGDAYRPNAMPIFALGLNGETSLRAGLDPNSADDEKQFSDDLSDTIVKSKGIVLAAGTAQGSGTSIQFDSLSDIRSTNVSHLFTQNSSWSFDIYPTKFGRILELGSGQKLELSNGGELTFTVETTAGSHAVSYPGIQLNEWYQVAARIHEGELQLFVNDFSDPITASISGAIIYAGNQLKIGGGFEGKLSNVHLYDLSSEPLLRIVQGDEIGEGLDNPNTPTTTQTFSLGSNGWHNAKIVSTGNMNKSGTTLDMLYVNVQAGDTHLHVPLMSESGFKTVAARAADIGAVGPPIVFRHYDTNGQPIINYADVSDPWKSLPLSSVVNSAHAFDLVSLLDFVIPISSILDIADQISKIGTEEFNPVLLIVSGLDVALSFSGPLKPFLTPVFKPLKKLAANPAVSKFVKILAPVFGKAADKAIKTKSLKPVRALLPFLLIVGEVAADEDAREAIPIIMDAISSSEDMQTWFDFFALPSEAWEGSEIPELALFPEDDQVASNTLPLSNLFPVAYASKAKHLRKAGTKAAKELLEVVDKVKSGNITRKQAAESITKAMGEIIGAARENVSIRGALTDVKTLTAGASLVTHGGARYIRNLIRGKGADGKQVSSRTPIFLQLAAIAYLESRISDSCTQYCIKKAAMIDEIRGLYAKALAFPLVQGYDNPRIAGYQFHLTMAALMHLWGEQGGDYGKLVAIEQKNDIGLWTYNADGETVKAFKDPLNKSKYTRYVDLVTQKSGEEKVTFIELKSYKGQALSGKSFKEVDIKGSFSTWSFKKDDGSNQGNHRQYLLDRIANTNNGLIEIKEDREKAYLANEIHWLFQSYKQASVKGLTQNQIKEVRKLLAKTSTAHRKEINASLGYKKKEGYDSKGAQSQADKAIKLFNMKEVLKSSSSALTETLFDMSGLDSEDKDSLKQKIEDLVLSRLEDAA